jgi:hypothetical protein
MRGTYVVAGIFAIHSEGVTVPEMRRNIPALHAAAKKAKKHFFFHFTSATTLIPR